MKFEYLDSYKYKIKTAPELIEILGDFPRTKSAILCHGVFDMLHPGHIIHLQKAKSLADILIVSITADKFVNKGPGRPVFSEIERARVLSALKIVDFVLIRSLLCVIISKKI